jgi:hypothetical protein
MEYCNNMIYLGRGNDDDDDEDVIMILLCSVEIDVFVVEGIDGEERARVKGGEAATGPLAQYSHQSNALRYWSFSSTHRTATEIRPSRHYSRPI